MRSALLVMVFAVAVLIAGCARNLEQDKKTAPPGSLERRDPAALLQPDQSPGASGYAVASMAGLPRS